MTRRFQKRFSGAVLLKYFLWLALVPLIICFNGCGSVDQEKKEEKDEKKEDRFAFLRRNEQKKVQKAVENLEDELIKSKQPQAVQLTPETLKNLEAQDVITREDFKDGVLAKGTGKKSGRRKFYEDFILLNGDEELAVSLIFNSAPLLDVLSAFADVLGFNFVADSDIKSTVT